MQDRKEEKYKEVKGENRRMSKMSDIKNESAQWQRKREKAIML